MRRLVHPALACSLALLLGSGCFTATRVEKRLQRITVDSEPTEAELVQITNQGEIALGKTPAAFQVPYEVKAERIHSGWWWTGIGLGLAGGVAGLVVRDNDDPTWAETGDYLLYGGVILAAFTATLWYLFGDKVLSEEVNQEMPVRLEARMPGFRGRPFDFKVPLEKPELVLPLAPAPAEPAPAGPAPLQPGTAAPGPGGPEAGAPAPAGPAPVEPAPAEPAPAEPSPAPGAPAPVAGPQRLAVLDLQDLSKKFDDATLFQVSEYLTARLASAPGLELVPRSQVRARLEVERKAGSACTDEACLFEVGRAVGADALVLTQLIRVGGRCALTGTRFDLARASAVRSAVQSIECKAEALLPGVDALAEQLR